MKNFLLSYGTLRRGDLAADLDDKISDGHKQNKTYNFCRFGENSQKFIKKLRLKGFSLVNLGPYPAAVKDQNGEITVELQEIESGAFENIYHMEKGAGYLSTTIEVEGVRAVIYYMADSRAAKYPKIQSGDWCA